MLAAHDLAFAAFSWVLQAWICSGRPFTPPFLLIAATSSWAAASAGASNGDMLPDRSTTNPSTIGFPAAFARVLAAVSAATDTTMTRSAASTADRWRVTGFLLRVGAEYRRCEEAASTWREHRPPPVWSGAMPPYDALLVGSGINSLACAALLSKAGWRVLVLEREDRLGGAIRTSTELTAPGYTHEVLSSWHPLFAGSAAYGELAEELGRRGLTYLNTDLPTATLFPGGEAAFLTTSLDGNAAELDRYAAGDGDAWRRQHEEFMASADLSFGVLGVELWSAQG